MINEKKNSDISYRVYLMFWPLRQEELPWAEGKVVKFKDLESAIPKGMKRVSIKERQQQLREREEQFYLRYVDK